VFVKVTSYLLKTLLTALSWLPRPVMQGFSGPLAWVLHRIIGYRLSVVTNNIERSFPDINNMEKLDIARRYYRHLAEMVWECILLLRLDFRKMERQIALNVSEPGIDASGGSHHAVIMAGHIGNWEYFNSILVRCGFRALAVYKPQSSQVADQIMTRLRKGHGVELAAMKDTHRIFAMLRDGEARTALLLVADQTPAMGEIQVWNRFLNQPTAWFSGGGKIALRLNLPVYYLHVQKSGFARYQSKLIQIRKVSEPLTEEEVTNRYARLLEDNIAKQPEIWLWSHRRWKHQPPETLSL